MQTIREPAGRPLRATDFWREISGINADGPGNSSRMGATRRAYLRGLATAGAVGLAGCTGGSSDAEQDADILAGPSGRFVFDPEEFTVNVGETVTWFFASAGHNVSGRPAASDHVELPQGGEPFSSYDPAAGPFELVPKGETFTHTFETPGDFQYVCVPHISSGMVGRVVVDG